MVFFSIGIVLYLFFSYTYSFHMWRERGDDDAVDDSDDVDEIDDDIIEDEKNDGNADGEKNNNKG